MAERSFDRYRVRSGATLEGSRYTAWLAVTPLQRGFPVYYAICENRSFRQQAQAEQAADAALQAVLGLEDDGTPVFPDGYEGPGEAPPGTRD